jgi:hypothetical protein
VVGAAADNSNPDAVTRPLGVLNPQRLSDDPAIAEKGD